MANPGVGDAIFVKRRNDPEWHESKVTAICRSGALVILTGHEDHYVLPPDDIDELVVGTGRGLPQRVRTDGGDVVRFGTRCSRVQLARITTEAENLAAEYDRAQHRDNNKSYAYHRNITGTS